ncbi:MAG: pyruvate, phosphate dikinase [Desulfobacterales bacterium]|nr:pyruvate, phosphate dikinase [Desulfobacterales bacterium]
MSKYVFCFGNKQAEGAISDVNILGGKGANLCEMAILGLPVPPGFIISTECCNEFLKAGGKFSDDLEKQILQGLKHVESIMGARFGSVDNPLLVSCRSGARKSMPGMMETVLNVGLTSETINGLIKKTKNKRFVYDAYRRLIMMYSDVVMEKAEGIEPQEGLGIRVQLEKIMHDLKKKKYYSHDTEVNADELEYLCEKFKEKVKEVLNKEFPDDPMEQLKGSIAAVFKSWNGKRAISYRKIEGIPDEWGTAVTVQSMVFGNMGDNSATGVAFTRNPATGENLFYGEWLPNAQGEDVVAGIRTPYPLNEANKSDHNDYLTSLEVRMPGIYRELNDIRNILEIHYKDMMDIEFTIQDARLYMLQCRVGKRTGTASLNIALDMLKDGLIDETTCVTRVMPNQLDELLHPVVDPEAEKNANVLAKGLPAGPGGAYGKIVFTSDDAVRLATPQRNVILVREETSPEDVEGMRAAAGILTARGGMTSHAALVARGWGKCCIVGAGALKIDVEAKRLKVENKTFKEGDIITLNGTKGLVYEGMLNMIDSSENLRLKEFMAIADKYRTMGVRTNADTPEDSKIARQFGAEGIGLFRTEHMFYGTKLEEPLFLLRKMILSPSYFERKEALDELFPFVKDEIKGTLEAMDGLPVTIRLLDPPLHEFVPHNREHVVRFAKALHVDEKEIRRRIEDLEESNPMMGHRGVRLGISYPEITEMQAKAIFEASCELIKQGKNPLPEIMIPVTCDVNELKVTKKIIDQVYEETLKKFSLPKIEYKFGTMIEIPRAALLANKMAEIAEFFSFGTNDLTQMTFGFSRDDTGNFLGEYLDKKILESDPFQTIDQEGVGQLIAYAVENGRKTKPNLKIGICGEQGGEPKSVDFCYKCGLNYVSCSPYRVPIARLSAAHAAIKAKK